MLGKLKEAIFQYSERRNDRKYGISTAATFRPDDLGSDHELHLYSSISYKRIEQALDLVPVDPGKDVFIDYGSGKGRVLVLAAMRPFKRVIGVELSPQLHADAQKNIANARARLACKDVELVCGDARNYLVPDDLTVAYFWSPFGSEILLKVLSNIHASVLRAPREVRIIYVYTQGLSCIEQIMPNMPWLKNYAEQPLGNLVMGLGRIAKA